MNDFKAESLQLKEEMYEATRRVIDSGHYILGSELEEFEKKWADICVVKQAIGVANGLDAIELILRSLDIGVGDEVITTPVTAFATVLAILKVGALPVLADIRADTGLICIESVKRCISKKTKAILLVHIYGQIRDMDLWLELCIENKIQLIEDCAQSHLACLSGKFAGTFGIAGAYSFYPTKNLGALGDAGMVITNDDVIADRVKCIRNYGQSVRYEHPEIGMNSRLDEIQAALLCVRVKWLLDYDEKRKLVADAYRIGIHNKKIKLLAPPQERSAHANHLFVLNTADRYDLQRFLSNKAIQTLIHYPIPIHHQQPCRELRRDPQGLAVAELHAQTCLSLPCNPQLSDSDISYVIEAINSY